MLITVRRVSVNCVELNWSELLRFSEREILEKWTYLLTVLEAKRKQIMGLNDLMSLLRDIDTLKSELKVLEVGRESFISA